MKWTRAIEITHAVLDTITPLAQNIILQVQQLEPCEKFFDKIADLHGAIVVS